MSFYEAPTENLAIFDPLVFVSNDTPLTIATGSKYFLRFPYAQNTENLQAINVNGVATFNSTSEFKQKLNMSSTVSSVNRTVASSYYNFYDSNVAGSLNQNGTLYNSNGAMYLQNTTNSGNINFVLNDAGGVQNTPLQLLNAGINLNKPTTISANNNLNMPAGTGIINQSIVTSDTTTKNAFKLSQFVYNSNVAGGTATAFEFYDGVNGKGLFLLPNSGNGSLSSTNMPNDCCLTSRSSQDNNAITISNWNTNLKNGLRVFTTDVSNCGLTLQCGQNSTADYTELKMAYSRPTNTTLTTFNNVINFNPTVPSAILSSRRRLEGLGTLSFTDISGNNTTTGSSTSSIYMDSSGSLKGMFYDCSLNSASHNFKVNDGSGNKITLLSITPVDIDTNVPINFNTNASALRQIQNLGTLNFLDVSGSASISNIYMDTTATVPGMFYDCSLNNGSHNFTVNDGAGNKVTPVYYGASLTSILNTLSVRNSTTVSNRFDISTDNSQITTMLARAGTTPSVSTTLNINTGSTNGSGTFTSAPVLTLTPTYLETKRPIQFNYSTLPTLPTQLGYSLPPVALSSSSFATSPSTRNLSNFTIPNSGTYVINVSYWISPVGTPAVVSEFTVALDGTSATYPSISTPTIYSTSLAGDFNIGTLSLSDTKYTRTALNLRLTGSTVIYLNFTLIFTGGGNVIMGATISYTRVG